MFVFHTFLQNKKVKIFLVAEYFNENVIEKKKQNEKLKLKLLNVIFNEVHQFLILWSRFDKYHKKFMSFSYYNQRY